MNGKPSSPVLRGLGASNGARLLDPWHYFRFARDPPGTGDKLQTHDSYFPRDLPVVFPKEVCHPSCWKPKCDGVMKQKADVLQGTLALMVLKTLGVLGPQHGYGIARRIEQISGDLLAVNQETLAAEAGARRSDCVRVGCLRE